jgi:hypothetical protein
MKTLITQFPPSIVNNNLLLGYKAEPFALALSTVGCVWNAASSHTTQEKASPALRCLATIHYELDHISDVDNILNEDGGAVKAGQHFRHIPLNI